MGAGDAAATCEGALRVLFERYAAQGRDDFAPWRGGRDAMTFQRFSALARDTGLASDRGAVAVAFERRSAPGKRRGVTDFAGFLEIVRELAAEQRGDDLQNFARRVMAERPEVWNAALAARAARQPRDAARRPAGPVDVQLQSELFAFYSPEGSDQLGFDGFLRMTRDFELHPRLCSRRALVRAFQTAAASETLTLCEFLVALENLALAIFDQSYVEDDWRARAIETLLDLFRSCYERLARIQTELRNRRMRQRRASLRPRRSRSPPFSAVSDPPFLGTETPAYLQHPPYVQHPPSQPSLGLASDVSSQALSAALVPAVTSAAPACEPRPREDVAAGSAPCGPNDEEAKSEEQARRDAFAGCAMPQKDTFMLRAPPSPPSKANHRITIHHDGTIDVLRVSYATTSLTAPVAPLVD